MKQCYCIGSCNHILATEKHGNTLYLSDWKKDNYDALYVYFIEATQENHK